MDELRPFAGLGGVPLVLAMVEVAKRVFPKLEARWYPLLSLAFGVLIAVGLALLFQTHLGVAVATGLISGLTASGAFSGTKAAVVEPIKQAQEETQRQKWMERLHPRG